MRLFGKKISYNPGGTFGGKNSDRQLADDLIRMIREHAPIIITLQEVWDRKRALQWVAEATGYQLVQPKGAAGHNAALVHPDAKLVGLLGTLLLTARRFVGRKVAGAQKHGMARKNELVFVRYDYGGRKWIDAIIHAVPSHRIRRARIVARIQYARAWAWLIRRMRLAMLSGDLNQKKGSRWGLMRIFDNGLAWSLTGKPVKGKHSGIDYWIGLHRQLRAAGLEVRVTSLEGYAGDHPPQLLEIFEV